MFRLARSVGQGSFAQIFTQPEEKTIDFLHKKGFSEGFIKRFFVPFFAGACLDPGIQASSRVLQYIFRLFAEGDAALPAHGMGDISRQLASKLPQAALRLNSKAVSIDGGIVSLADGSKIIGRKVVIATSQPALENLLGQPSSHSSIGESCLYFAGQWRPPFKDPFLVLNGDGQGPISNIAFPSLAAPSYSASGKALIAVVVLGQKYLGKEDIVSQVRSQCFEWFGNAVRDWTHLHTYHIKHALPNQAPHPRPIRASRTSSRRYASLRRTSKPAGNSMVTALRSQNGGGDCWRVMLKDLQVAFHQLQKSCFQHVSGVLK